MKSIINNNYFNIFLISWSWIVWWLINYFYHPIMLKFLGINDFWVFASLVWIFNILWVVLSWIILFLNKEYSKNINNIEKLKYIFVNALKILSTIWLILFSIYVLFSPIIKNFLNLESNWYIIIIWTSLISAFVWSSLDSLLRSLKKFHIIAILTIIWPILKLVIWVSLVYLWFSIYGAIWWFVISGFLLIIIYFIYVKKYFKWVKSIWTTKELVNDFIKNRKSILNYFFVSLFFAIFMNADVILAKNIFTPEIAWIYAWISVLWKILIFLMLSIETVYYWQIMEYKKDKLPFHLIKNPVILMITWTILSLLINFFIWWYLLDMLEKWLSSYINIYLMSLLFYSLIAFISFFTKVLVGWWKYYINYVFLFLSVLLITIVYTFWNNNLEYFIYTFVWVWIFWVILSWWIFFFEYAKK